MRRWERPDLSGRRRGGELRLVGVFPSGGAGPVSLTYRDGLLNVLNAANGRNEPANVSGFCVDHNGELHAIPGATRPLGATHPNPAQVLLDLSRRYRVVTEKGTNLIDVCWVGRDGQLGDPKTMRSVGDIPSGLAVARFTSGSQLFVVADATGAPPTTGVATAIKMNDGQLRSTNGAVPDYQLAPCWMVITKDARYAYTSNADGQTISGYRIHSEGTISLLNANGVTATTPADTFPLEVALNRDSLYLYLLDSRLLLTPPGPVTLSGFRIHADGRLTSVVDPAKISLPFSALGLAAY